MNRDYLSYIRKEILSIKEQSLYKDEQFISSPQQVNIQMEGKSYVNFCANNYLGLANHPDILKSAKEALDQYGYGMASVRFICGTQELHRKLEIRLSEFLQKEDTILYSSCFDANTGLFETLLNAEDAIFSDSLNHASIIDGVRLCKAKRHRYKSRELGTLESQLRDSSESRFRLICTDGVFSMDGYYANLKELVNLSEKYNALLVVDDSHAVGFIGENGRGTHEYFKVTQGVDVLTGTLGKALGGASGGYVSGPKEIIEYLRQKSRPYLFSNTLSPVIAATSLTALDIVEKNPQLRQQLHENTSYFRSEIENIGFSTLEGSHPIVPIMIKNDKKSSLFAKDLLLEGIYAVSFSYPVVPLGTSRIRVQLSAAHTRDDLDKALDAFQRIGKKHSVL